MYPYASYMKSPQSRMLQAQMEVMKFMNPCQYQALMGEFEARTGNLAWRGCAR